MLVQIDLPISKIPKDCFSCPYRRQRKLIMMDEIGNQIWYEPSEEEDDCIWFCTLMNQKVVLPAYFPNLNRIKGLEREWPKTFRHKDCPLAAEEEGSPF